MHKSYLNKKMQKWAFNFEDETPLLGHHEATVPAQIWQIGNQNQNAENPSSNANI